jgi:hypothetical protein
VGFFHHHGARHAGFSARQGRQLARTLRLRQCLARRPAGQCRTGHTAGQQLHHLAPPCVGPLGCDFAGNRVNETVVVRLDQHGDSLEVLS